MKWTNRLGKWLFVGGAWSATALMLGAAGTGCLARPVGQQPPTTKVNFTSTVSQQAVDKVDLLFAIDNSASMGDKQAILADAVPDLINGLLKPRCVDSDGKPDSKGSVADPAGNKENRYGCPVNFEPEFKPVTDMHIGVVSSSLGNFGGDVCVAANPRTNDRGRLLNINPNGGEIDLAKPGNFLAWFPQAEENNDPKRHPPPEKPIRTIDGADGLTENFRNLVVGVGQNGCGLEAQLESVYRFLIQPDPWDVVKLDNFNQADLGDGVDIEVLQQRADFLRPDSLVAIIMLTDEDDSSADPLAIGGQGWAFMAKNFPGSKVFRGGTGQGTTAPRGTTACQDPKLGPGSEECTSCGFQSLCDPNQPSCQKIKQDANCTKPGQADKNGEGYNGYYGSKDDELNVRFHRMKERYGIDPQYPIRRYVDGFTKFRVPDRKAEHVTKVAANGRRDIASYTSTAKCTNPLFAAKLPRATGDELCSLPRSTRSPDLIFFAVVGGVPHQLLHFDAEDPEKSRITNDDWVKILGRDPANFDFDGIDPHMIQSVAPRTQAGLKGADQPRGSNGDDKIHGREWNTDQSDLQYACTFDLPQPRECAANDPSCDCTPESSTNQPLCGQGNQQIKAKAYPTTREFQVVRALGDQGVISSLCPIQLDNPTLPTYGYRPAVAAIIDRLKNALTTQCLPQKLREANAEPAPVPCLVLAQLSEPTDKCETYGLQPPAKAILDVFLEQQRAETGNAGDGGLDLAALPVCEIPQETVGRGDTCKDVTDKRWCYVENDPGNKKNPAGRCPQALIFSSGTAELVGARFSLQCIQQFAAGEAAGD
ncbi:MAG: hypothetical protein KF764_16315 [Labilithrix sp.]|nr:hypothetical protein [Labilithrix sp.]MBX3222046.1 hypothetical protein [Labilithrix sp.]